ncbi:MAG: CinA family protein [Gammaproteobacteria bacterium]|uniref:CinA family protein n=1 Tax=Candidatus Thiopontia autotrophica TaxID=2841688 RepID=A0A8J6NY23_9GAMM|nr:CinA family protein [Candidatus Thiopontia autotrophica]
MQYEIENVVNELSRELLKHGLMLVTAESCTAGWISKVMTDPAGSSGWFERGFVTYSNESKMEMLGVSEQTLQQYGAVSIETVQEMVTGALDRSSADVAVAVSGIAGPTGGSDDKPVGLVWFGWQGRDDLFHGESVVFDGNRNEIREQTVLYALEKVLQNIKLVR